MKSLRFALPLLASLFTSSLAGAQDVRGVDIERFSPALDASSYLTIQATAPPGAWQWNTQLSLGWGYRPFTATNAAGERFAVLDDRTTAALAFQLGLGERGAIGIYMPLVLWQGRGDVTLGGGAPGRTAFGDPRISLRYKLFGEVASERVDRPEGPGLAIQLSSTLPLGSQDAFFAESLPRLGLELVGEFRLLGFGVAAKFGYRHRFAERVLLDSRFAGELEAALGVQAPLPWVRDLSGVVEVRAIVGLTDPFSRGTSAVEAAIGGRYRIGDLALTTSVAFGLSSGIGVSIVRPTLDLSWAPRKHDQDSDGISDSADQCPPLPEDFDGFQDDDGCPDPDNDNDMIPDEDDSCPLDAAEEGRDDDEDGCTDM